MKIFGIEAFNENRIAEVNPTERKAKLVDALGHFIKKFSAMPIEAQKLTGIDTSLRSSQNPIVLVSSDTIKTPDRGYETLFKTVDMRSSTNPTFDVLDVSGLVTYYQVVTGEEPKLSILPTATKSSVSLMRFIGGFTILDDWLRFNDYQKIADLTENAISQWYKKKSTIFYGLLTALSSGINESYVTDDVTTINNACSKIISDMYAAGYNVDEGAEFTITCNQSLRARIMKALSAAFFMPNTNNNQIVFNVNNLISTPNVANTSYYVSLPGIKNLRGEWEDFNGRPAERNELRLGEDLIWTGAYNGVIAESKQHRRCALS